MNYPSLPAIDESTCSEGAVQAYCFLYCWNYLPQTRYCFFAVPNGGSRGKVEGSRMKAMGTVAGITDTIFLWSGKMYGLEFKELKGVLRKKQEACHAAWKKQGVETYVIREFLPFRDLIHEITGLPMAV